MSLFGSNKTPSSSQKTSSASSGGQKPTPTPPPPPPPSGFFGGKKEFTRSEFRERMAKDSGKIPGTGGVFYSKEERIGLEKKFSQGKYGLNISKDDIKRHIQDIQKERSQTIDDGKRQALKREMDYWQGKI
jgi:hypothetical protein